jgi:hypothetical protein
MINGEKYRWLIGIDPGVNTGIAIYDKAKKGFVLIETVQIVNAHNYLANHNHKSQMFLRIEDARKRNWFGMKGKEALQGAGSIKRDCQIWEQFCDLHGIEYEMVPPKNNRTKLDASVFSAYTGWKKQTSQHARDAAMLVWGF